jgi:small-conductance mechanosensitive channel
MFGGATEAIEKEADKLKEDIRTLKEAKEKIQETEVETADDKKLRDQRLNKVRRMLKETIGNYQATKMKLKQLLKDAGFPDGKNLPEIQLITTAVYLDV